MVSLEEVKRILAEDASSYSDEELEAIKKSLYEVGQLAFDVWIAEKFSSKDPVGEFIIDSNLDTI